VARHRGPDPPGLFVAADPEYLGDLSDPMKLIVDTLGRVEAYVDELTAARRAHPTDDLATVIGNGEIDGVPLGHLERLWYCIIVATAGHDTTPVALSGGFEQLHTPLSRRLELGAWFV
jgi:cytochrome P450